MLRALILSLAAVVSVPHAAASEGQLNIIVITLHLPSATVATWVGDDVVIAADSAATHPVLLLVGSKTAVSHQNGPTIPGFHEVSVLVPRVQLPHSEGELLYLVDTFIDNRRAQWLNRLYLSQRSTAMATAIADDGPWQAMHPWRRRAWLSAEFKPGFLRDISIAHPNLHQIMLTLAQPIMWPAPTPSSRHLCSRLIIEPDALHLESIKSKISIFRGFLPGIDTLEQTIDAVDRTPSGSFRMRGPWRMDRPFPCR